MDEELLESAIRVGHELFLVTNDMMEAPISRLGLTQATAAALAGIDPSEDPPASMKTLSRRLHCNASSVTFLIDQLRDRGLVERVPAATDGRQRAAVLTAEGHRVRAEVLQIARAESPLSFLAPVDVATVERLLRAALEARASRGPATNHAHPS